MQLPKTPLWKRALDRFRQEWKDRNDARAVTYQNGDGELLRFAFTDPLSETELVLPPSLSIKEVSARVEELFFPVNDFWSAYDELDVHEVTSKSERLFLDYSIGNRAYRTACLSQCTAPANPVALIIPGSGHNQSRAIFNREAGNYHGAIYQQLAGSHEPYIYVKPNEDFLAIHNGLRKLHSDFYLNQLLNRGGSYSARYLVDLMAWTKFWQSSGRDVHLYGCSQGGTAALYVALQAEPASTTIAAGYSPLNQELLWSGPGQIVIPGLEQHYPISTMRAKLSKLATRFHFTVGKKDWGTFQLDGARGLTKQQFAGLSNVTVSRHPEGHTFP